MSQDYTVAKELASLKEIKQSAEQRISDLSLNALNYVNDHRLHKTGGGGGGGGVLVVSPNLDTGVLDKTWKEITDAPFAVLKFTDDNITYQICPLSSYDEKAQGVYYNVKFKLNEELSFTASTNDPDGYPIITE